MQQHSHLIDLGTLSGGKNEPAWVGKISLAARIKSGEITKTELSEADSRINDSFVPVSKGAAKRCIDGSSIEGYDDNDPAWRERGLGPQIQGGIADEALANRLTTGVSQNEHEVPTLLADIEATAKEHSTDFAPGDHTDDHATDENTGCGAINGMAIRLGMLNDPVIAPVIETVTATIMGLVNVPFDQAAFKTLQQHAKELMTINYLPAKGVEVLDKIREINPNGIEKLIRPHAECFLTLNFVSGTTFNRDHFNAVTRSKIQNFNLDAWYILEEYGANGLALVVDAVATAMNLTDGTLQLRARMQVA